MTEQIEHKTREISGGIVFAQRFIEGELGSAKEACREVLDMIEAVDLGKSKMEYGGNAFILHVGRETVQLECLFEDGPCEIPTPKFKGMVEEWLRWITENPPAP